MSQYNQFIYYQENNQLDVFPNNETGIFAFIIYNANIGPDDLDMPTLPQNKWEVETSSRGGDPERFNLLFRYKPNDTYTVLNTSNRLVFKVLNGKSLEAGLTVDWVNDVTNTGSASQGSESDPLSSAFSNTFPQNWNRELMSENAGAGTGDPHIRCYFGPTNSIYVLPTNNYVYKYFDNQDLEERIVINTQMWLLSFDRIVFAEELLRRNYVNEHRLALDMITKHPLTMDKVKPFDTSFAKTICINIDDIPFMIDMETLEPELESESSNKIELSNIMESDGKYYQTKSGSTINCVMRIITINTKKMGWIKLYLYRDYKRLNHRNHIHIVFEKYHKDDLRNCSGILMYRRCHDAIVPSLTHIGRIDYENRSNNQLIRLESYLGRHKDILRKRRLHIRQMVREQCFDLLQDNIDHINVEKFVEPPKDLRTKQFYAKNNSLSTII